MKDERKIGSRVTVRWIFRATNEGPDAFLKLAARKQDAMLALLTNNPNIRAQPNNLPFESAARVRLA